jgi:hypothetical protein
MPEVTRYQGTAEAAFLNYLEWKKQMWNAKHQMACMNIFLSQLDICALYWRELPDGLMEAFKHLRVLHDVKK